MTKQLKDIEIGKTYQSNNYGEFIVESITSSTEVHILFTATGYRTTTLAGSIRDGEVRDKLKPIVANVGYIGIGSYPTQCTTNRTDGSNKCYVLWNGMLNRCYNPKDTMYSLYGGRGVRVCEAWHCYQTFAAWADKQDYQVGMHLDKDIYGNGLLYSPDTCRFVTPQANAEKAKAKEYMLCNPQGEVVTIYNMAKHCKQHGLSSGAMSEVISGKRRSHKGWTKA
ncbi:hypothetical protein [Vibrio harveyi]|uniref:hypothetical protein n=1 Tax=Vibrio harveyi TaxID=669 RepID=UPI00390A003E